MLTKLLSLLFKRPRRQPARRASARIDAGPTTPQRSEAQSSGHRRRTPERDQDRVLSSASVAWLKTLPEEMRPADLAMCHPRVVNRIALCWNDAELMNRLFDELLLDKRGKRRGFAPKVGDDLMRLRVYHGKLHGQESDVVWQLQSVALSDRDPGFSR